ncbi:hypothetical protein Sjap_000826 [Stephania japonica]|uniref:DDT domain-containing protein n=1 Tax=Stephania japonica TaxID=461633 RepID=A0AAP0KIU6_9MAGN
MARASQRAKQRISSKYNRLPLVDLGKFNDNDGNDDRRAMSLMKKRPVIRGTKRKQKPRTRLQEDLLPLGHLVLKFRKDGPPLGIEFDALPAGAFQHSRVGLCTKMPTPRIPYSMFRAHLYKYSRKVGVRSVSELSVSLCVSIHRKETLSPMRRRDSLLSSNLTVYKFLDALNRDYSSVLAFLTTLLALVLWSDNLSSHACSEKSGPVTKHGVGKGLMTVWQATNPGPGIGKGLMSRQAKSMFSRSLKPLVQKTKRPQLQKLTKPKPKPKPKTFTSDKLYQAECNLSVARLLSEECPYTSAALVDDEELELEELQAGPNPLTCSAHLSSNGILGCSLCKDLLARFPPPVVKMKLPLHFQPWDSSLELVKKLFKVFRFMYNHASLADIPPFTLDEFAQAFHDKDSALLGKVHLAILKLFLSDVEMELNSGFVPHASKDCRFLAFLHSVRHQHFIVRIWNRSLNALTWTEILRQVFVAAGFSSKQSHLHSNSCDKEKTLLAEYGLSSGTLKGVLFSLLSEQGNNGMKVSDMAKASQVVELKLTNSMDELECLICSTLSSDITLFEKLSPSSYRLRATASIAKAASDLESDTDCGSVDDDSRRSLTKDSSDESDDSDLDSARSSLSIIKQKEHRKNNDNVLAEYNEIDESHPGEVWVLGLMEGEYSDLSVEEKLSALIALVDLTSVLSSTRMEVCALVHLGTLPSCKDAEGVITEGSSIIHHGGAKIKRSSAKQRKLHKPSYDHMSNLDHMKGINNSVEPLHYDSSPAILNPLRKENFSKDNNGLYGKNHSQSIEEVVANEHAMQSILLGYDRRFNRYWLLLGPCNVKDPGHRRIYFESSEDGHWEVIDTEEALCALLSILDNRGAREACLLSSLKKREMFLRQAMSNKVGIDDEMRQLIQSEQSSIDMSSCDGSPVSAVDNNSTLSDTSKDHLVSTGETILDAGRKGRCEKQNWSRCQAFDAWIWECFYSSLNAVKYGKMSYLDSLTRCVSCHDLYWRDEKHCKICHTTFELDFDLEERYLIHKACCKDKGDYDGTFPNYKVLQSQLQSLKAALHAIEAVMPKDALVGSWTTCTRKLWVKRLRRSSSLPELLQVLANFVGAINENWLYECCTDGGPHTALNEIVVFFPTMPQTTSAVALWLVKLDSLIAPHLKRVNFRKNRGSNNR